MPIKAYYNAAVSSFLKDDSERILGVLTAAYHHALEESQRWAWVQSSRSSKLPSPANPKGESFSNSTFREWVSAQTPY